MVVPARVCLTLSCIDQTVNAQLCSAKFTSPPLDVRLGGCRCDAGSAASVSASSRDAGQEPGIIPWRRVSARRFAVLEFAHNLRLLQQVGSVNINVALWECPHYPALQQTVDGM